MGSQCSNYDYDSNICLEHASYFYDVLDTKKRANTASVPNMSLISDKG